MTDLAKRMINASGYKVWPAEVEAVLYQHPAVKEVCVVGTQDSYRGETVKALIVPHHGSQATPDEVIDWSRQRMAAYKHPRIVEFKDDFPKSPVRKILWRELQEAQKAKYAIRPSSIQHARQQACPWIKCKGTGINLLSPDSL